MYTGNLGIDSMGTQEEQKSSERKRGRDSESTAWPYLSCVPLLFSIVKTEIKLEEAVEVYILVTLLFASERGSSERETRDKCPSR